MSKKIITTICVIIILIGACFAGNVFLNPGESKTKQEIVLRQNRDTNNVIDKTEEKGNVSTEDEIVSDEKQKPDKSLGEDLPVDSSSVDENADELKENVEETVSEAKRETVKKNSDKSHKVVTSEKAVIPEERLTCALPVDSSSVDKNADELKENIEETVLKEKKETVKKDSNKSHEVVVSEKNVVPEERLTCTLSVECLSVLENIHKLKESKKEFIPEDGIILKEIEVEFFSDESVFDVLCRELKNNNIHFEFVKTPAYNSAYIEGIANLYEFDCGEFSGWLYKVNGIKPTYGSSQYKLKNNDRIEFFYSCNFFE